MILLLFLILTSVMIFLNTGFQISSLIKKKSRNSGKSQLFAQRFKWLFQWSSSEFLMRLKIPKLCNSGILLWLNKDKIFELRNSKISLSLKISYDVTIRLNSDLWHHNAYFGFLTRKFQIPKISNLLNNF